MKLRGWNDFNGVALVAAVAAPLALGGCASWFEGTWVDFWSDDEVAEAPANRLEADRGQPPPGGDRAYPAVSDTPAVPRVGSGEDRQRIAEGLVADNQRARYSGDVIQRQGDVPDDLFRRPATASPPPAPDLPAAQTPRQMASGAAQSTQTASAPAPRDLPDMPWLGQRPQELRAVTSEAESDSRMPQRPAGPTDGAWPGAHGRGFGSVVVAGSGVIDDGYGGGSGGNLTDADRSAGLSANALKVATIQFDNGSSDLRDPDRSILRQVVMLHKQRGGKVRVIGHASSRTPNMDEVQHKMVNFEISMARASAVADELVRLGAARGDVQVAAVSDHSPVFYEVMPSGEAGNRRTEIYFDY